MVDSQTFSSGMERMGTFCYFVDYPSWVQWTDQTEEKAQQKELAIMNHVSCS